MNHFVNFYIDNVIKAFRTYNNSLFNISIRGFGLFVNKEDRIFAYLFSQLANYGFIVNLNTDDAEECFCVITIIGKNQETGEVYNFCYNVQDLLYLIDLSSKTKVSVMCIMVMKIIALFIGRLKTLYKAVVLDLDDTLWNGTLSEDGINKIITNQKATTGVQFIRFANFVKILADSLGIYVAICSRNDFKMVSKTMDVLNKEIFPLKNSIDCVIANDNDKSSNIKEIAANLSILPNSIVFIDDNELVRDEVRNNIPGICVPNWNTHEELITLLSVGCVFDRYELSLNAQNRRKQYKMIQVLRSNNHLPVLNVKAIRDINHVIAEKLYKKSNQFNMSQQNSILSQYVISVYFEIYRPNGESLGICSAISYIIDDNMIAVKNWAISCRFFEIGLENSILLYLVEKANGRRIMFEYSKTEYNNKATSMVVSNEEFKCASKNTYIEYSYTQSTKDKLRLKTNLEIKYDEK